MRIFGMQRDPRARFRRFSVWNAQLVPIREYKLKGRMKPMDFDRIKSRLDALLSAGKKAELRGALNMLNEVDIA